MGKLFGTNGIRGVVNKDMNCDLALGIGKAWGTLIKRKIQKPKVAIGTDARLSNDMLKNAISAGLLSTGCDVIDIGVVPTPTLQYTVREKGFDSGVIITASHNPPHFNGIKGVAADGTEFTKDIEDEIEKIYFEKKFMLSDWKNVGKISFWDGSIDLYINGILKVADVEADIGVVQDGDADRAIFIDEKGTYIWGDKTLALVAKYATKENAGIVVTPVTTSSCFDDVVIKNNGYVIHTAVGSPIVARVMIKEKAVFGGEENGGLIFPEMQYCRDSAMSIAKILE